MRRKIISLSLKALSDRDEETMSSEMSFYVLINDYFLEPHQAFSNRTSMPDELLQIPKFIPRTFCLQGCGQHPPVPKHDLIGQKQL